MLRVALTGGIGTGKSHVVGLLRRRAIPTIEADQLARAVVEPDRPAHAAIRARFGDTVVAADGTLDRARLGAIVFDDPAARADLERIVHPPVRRAIEAWFRRCADATAARFAVADIPLLYETGRADRFDGVVVVTCGPDTQLARVMARDGLAEAAVRKRINAQLPLAEKVSRADWVVDTDGSFAETERQVETLCRAIAGRA